MTHFSTAPRLQARRLLARPLGAWAMATALGLAAGGASGAGYVDAGLGDVKPADKVVISTPRPVQVLFQFQTKGAPNGRGTKLLKPKVLEAVKDSGLFSEVSEAPAADGAVLNVVIDDVIAPKEMQAAEAQGAVTGATLFIAGTNIREHYEAQLDYIAGPDAPKITRTAKHAVVFQMGLINSTPTNAVKVDGGINGAVFAMTRQIVSNPLNELAKDPAFLPVAAVAAPTPTPAPAPAPAPTPAAPTAPSPTAAPGEPGGALR